MTTKHFLRITPIVILLAFTLPAISAPTEPVTTTAENIRLEALTNRLGEIKDMSKSEMTRSERKDLRKEVREIKKEMKTISGGVYLSVGAIIVVILLLILLL